jgi:hypothetical protein
MDAHSSITTTNQIIKCIALFLPAAGKDLAFLQNAIETHDG